MALRRLASETARGLGIRFGAPVPTALSDSAFTLRALAARGFATGKFQKYE